MWSSNEISYLINNWPIRSEEAIAKKLNRTMLAVHLKAKRLGLGGHVKGSHYFTGQNLANILGIDGHCVRNWIKLGLIKYRTAKLDRVTYLFELEDIEAFLKENPDKWDSRKIKGNLWIVEPDWLKEKRASDNLRPNREGKKWTPEEDRKVLDLYRKGYKLKGIGEIMNRSRSGIEHRINRLFEKE